MVKPDPETPPDSRDPTGMCPRCGRSSNFHVMGSLPISWDTKRYVSRVSGGGMERPEVVRVSSLVCMGCHQATAVVEGICSDEGTVSWRGVHWWPPPSSADLDEAIPDALRDGYAEAMRALSARAPRGAAVLLRRVIEGVVKTSGSDKAREVVQGGKLAAGLQRMADDGDLDKNLAEWATEVRLTGNAGGHFDLDTDVAQTEAEELATLARQLLNYVYEMPAKLRRARGQ